MAIIENEKWKNGRIKPGKLILHRCRGPPVSGQKISGGKFANRQVLHGRISSTECLNQPVKFHCFSG